MKSCFTVFSIIALVYCDREPNNIISLKAGLKISPFVANLTKDMNFKTDVRTIANTTYMTVDNEQVIENKQKITVNLPRVVKASQDILDYEVNYVKLDGVELELYKDYAFNITYSDNLVTSQPRPLIYYPKDNNELDFEFNIIQPSLTPEIFNSPPIKLSNVVSVNYVFFGIDENKNLKMYNFLENFNELNIKDYMSPADYFWNIHLKTLTNLVIDSNINGNVKYILLTDVENYSYIVRVTVTFGERLYVNVKPLLWFSDVLLNTETVTDFINKGDYFYIGLKGQGILCISTDKNFYISEYQDLKNGGSKVQLRVKDLQEIGDSIYVLVEDFGIKILDIRSPSKPSFSNFEFYHPFIKSMEIHKNPNFRQLFLGLVISNRQFVEGNEFFIELSLEDEFNPKLYKIYLNDKYMDIKYILNDPDYTYLFEHTSNSFYVLPRTITTNNYNSIFVVHVNELKNKEPKGKPFIFTDFEDLYDYLGFLTDDGITYVKTLNLNNAKVDLYFTKEGTYEIGLHTYTDSCEMSIDDVKMCKVMIDYKLHVAGLPTTQEQIKQILYYYIVVGYVGFTILLYVIYIKFYKAKTLDKNLSASKFEAPDMRKNHSNIPTDRYVRAITTELNVDSVRNSNIELSQSNI
jgi:hypothetical protein